jgi:hypothetical protein
MDRQFNHAAAKANLVCHIGYIAVAGLSAIFATP